MMGAMSPGPSLAVVLKHSLNGSMKNGMLAALSHGTGVGLYAGASLLGLGALMTQFPTVYQILVYLGAAYLAYLGIKILLAKPSNDELEVQKSEVSAAKALQDGFAIAFLHAMLAIFFLAFLPQFVVDGAGPVSAQLFLHGILILLVAACIEPPLVLIGGKVTGYLKSNTSAASWMDRGLGTLFVGLGIKLAMTDRI